MQLSLHTGGSIGTPRLRHDSDGHKLPSAHPELPMSPQAAVGQAPLGQQRVSHALGTGLLHLASPACSDMMNGLIPAALTALPDTRSCACTQVPSPGRRASSDSCVNKQRKGSAFPCQSKQTGSGFWSGLQHPGGSSGKGDCAVISHSSDPFPWVCSHWQVWGILVKNVPADFSAHGCQISYSQKWKGMGECVV